jgi:hypothetical protein
MLHEKIETEKMSFALAGSFLSFETHKFPIKILPVDFQKTSGVKSVWNDLVGIESEIDV